jgi:AraC family transcriptional regulator of adaptative response/methylated-DNA-[protein]-cysteine methyltransferase
MLRAVADRDRDWDGLFVVAVSTTGIACRPVCPSRPARPEHLSFFRTLEEARTAGFRPCLRCRPERHQNDPDWLTRLTTVVNAAGDARITDAALAEAGLDPVRIRRHFRRHHGVTFHAWARGQKVATAQRQLKHGTALDRVIIASGYESHSGFREAFGRLVGTTPGRARDGEPVHAISIDSPVGSLVAAAVDGGLCLLEFGDIARLEAQAPRLRRWFQGPIVAGPHPHLDHLRDEMTAYFAGQLRDFTVPLVIRGAPFELGVWAALRQIPFGTTRSYADIARAVDNPKAVRAVGSANGRNRLAIVIPCHRVVNADGRLGGYGGGLWRKRRLLEIEGVEV